MFLIIPCFVLALAFNHEFSFMEIMWTFSIYLEAVTLVPQLVMIVKSGETEAYVVWYIVATALYRGLYILNWIYRYNYESFYDIIAIVSGCIQTVVNSAISLYVLKVYKSQKAAYKLGTYISKDVSSYFTGEEKIQRKMPKVDEKVVSSQAPQTDLAPVHDSAKRLENIIDI